MSRILFTWELGGGLGHLMEMKPLARGLVERGHKVFAALKDLSRARPVLGPGIPLLQAPFKHRTPNGEGGHPTLLLSERNGYGGHPILLLSWQSEAIRRRRAGRCNANPPTAAAIPKNSIFDRIFRLTFTHLACLTIGVAVLRPLP